MYMLINVHILGLNYFKQDIKLHNTNGYVDSCTHMYSTGKLPTCDVSIIFYSVLLTTYEYDTELV